MQSYYESIRDNARLPYTKFDKVNQCPPHFHAGIELVYVLEGALYATINGTQYKVEKNTLLINNCYSIHTYAAQNCTSYVAVIPLSIVPTAQKMLMSNRFRHNMLQDDETRTLEFMMRTLVENPENEMIQKGMSYAILGTIAGKVPLDPINNNDQANVICRILNYLNDNYSERLTVEQVAARFGYSRSHFSHLFKSTIGYSLPQYLNILRCRSIGEDLLRTDTPVVDLATNAGFNNPHTFYSSFKTFYNMTPREYIRLHKDGRPLPQPTGMPENMPE